MEARDFAAILRAEGFAEAVPRSLAAGQRHAEQAGPEGVEYLARRRQPTG